LGRALTVLLAGCAGVSGLKVLLDLYGVLLVNSWKADPSNILASAWIHHGSSSREPGRSTRMPF
jgi:hypothetical protein